MLDEKADVRKFFKNLGKSPEGMSCIVACGISLVMATVNWLLPGVFHDPQTHKTEKWLAIWLSLPLLLILLHLRSLQLLDADGKAWAFIRSGVVLVPVLLLICLNF